MSAWRHVLVFALAGSCAVACSTEAEKLPPLPEVLVIVDTNLPVPLMASRLRVDLYDANGRWFDSSDVARPTVADWPASFGVYSDDESRVKSVWIRLRAYPDGQTNDYQGERFRDLPDLLTAAPESDGQPRLVKNGVDVTPAFEPTPLLTVDRLLRVDLTPKVKGAVRVLLDGACVGTMSRLGPGGLPQDDAETCVAEERVRVPVVRTPLDPDVALTSPTKAGTFGFDPCQPDEGTDEHICVAGAPTVLGVNGRTEYTPGVRLTLSPSPARFFTVAKFLMDRDEVTVGRYRTSVGLTWTGPLPAPNEASLAPTSSDPNGACTWSDIERNREGYPLNCIDWEAARIFCQHEGGDLPTELQWEHAATVAGKQEKTRYPWGNDLPTCDQAVYGRLPVIEKSVSCTAKGVGPPPYAQAKNDLSPLGIVALGGDLNEWVLDDAKAYTSKCWQDAPLADGRCVTPQAKAHVIRGASWAQPPSRGTFRYYNTTLEAGGGVGFRCVYPVAAR